MKLLLIECQARVGLGVVAEDLEIKDCGAFTSLMMKTSASLPISSVP